MVCSRSCPRRGRRTGFHNGGERGQVGVRLRRGAHPHQGGNIVARSDDGSLKVAGHHEHHDRRAERVVQHQHVENRLYPVGRADVRRNCIQRCTLARTAHASIASHTPAFAEHRPGSHDTGQFAQRSVSRDQT